MGFVFTTSKRQVSPTAAAKIAKVVPGIGKVGVFVNQPLQEVRDIAKECSLDYVQLHGDETPEYCQKVGFPVIKAFRITDMINPLKLADYPVDWLLLDSYVAGQPGGTGVAFAWEAMKDTACLLPRPFMVAGGLTVENVAKAIALLAPGGVDVSGGVETNGKKDSEKICQFIMAARKAARGEVDA